MNKKILIWILVTLCLVSFVSAVNFPEDFILHFSHDDANITSGNETNWFAAGNVGVITQAGSVAGVINEARDYDGTGDYTKIATYPAIEVGKGDFSWCFVVDVDSAAANDILMTNRWVVGDKFTSVYMNDATNIRFRMHSEQCEVGDADISVSAAFSDTASYNHICAIKNNDNLTITINGVMAVNTAVSPTWYVSLFNSHVPVALINGNRINNIKTPKNTFFIFSFS